MSDPGFFADVMASKGNEEAKDLVRQLGLDKPAPGCEHDWHYGGTINGAPVWDCQICGAKTER